MLNNDKIKFYHDPNTGHIYLPDQSEASSIK